MTALYGVWRAMRQRCNNPTARDYVFYGGRGIKVSVAWDRFKDFEDWASATSYAEGLQRPNQLQVRRG